MPVSAEDEGHIQAAVQRGAISASRVPYWRAVAEGGGYDMAVLDELAAVGPPQPVTASTRLDVRPGVAAAAPAGYPDDFVAELRQRHPGTVAAAESEGPAPRLFGSADLPPFTASGLDPSYLATLPWPLRCPVAAAPTLAGYDGLIWPHYDGSVWPHLATS